ncbi:Formate-tetrahydrofolate ligase [Franzmannia pantelleriensis]|uniref:Formate--tetrahydrofolate ligase n=1 Tax=Franzmannia pantelleriensis TaxID=48727 RepID=A0A1G9NFG2_9GAMM|nr:formate--tetrahydrofolate ligase [Halomonas pantelleriensis]SDL85220.1 Formate-tetrahydrofolate ligase [Halomonas pantelleriensis]
MSGQSPAAERHASAVNDNLRIARTARLWPIEEIAHRLGVPGEAVEPYGRGIAKLDLSAIGAQVGQPRGRYVVVSAITPTPLGEGKTTTAIGLTQGLQRLGHRASVALRQPSMGPTLGIKGGAAGGGHSQVVPMERINLHLTGDLHAVAAAHNLLAAMVDNHLHHRLEPQLDPQQIRWQRAIDINDRALRHIVLGLGEPVDGVPRQGSFEITAASEVMAILALADSLADLRQRLGRIVIGYDRDGQAVTAEQIHAAGAMAALLKEALKPNLLQTLEHAPALIHAGPFGNIAHGNSSIVADRIGLHGSDFLITEAGFGADMGAERFFNIKCRVSGLTPDAAVLVATVRALKYHSGRHRVVPGKPLPDSLLAENPQQVQEGGTNLLKQIDNIRAHGITPVVAINAFPSDHPSEHSAIIDLAAAVGVKAVVSSHVRDGGDGALALAEAVAESAAAGADFQYLYPDELPLEAKIARIATRLYGADDVAFSTTARRQLEHYQQQGYGHFPVCIAKSHLSLSADPTRLGAPEGWTLPVREVRLSAGAGFVYALCGDIRTLPGLGADPAAAHIDIDEHGEISGLF